MTRSPFLRRVVCAVALAWASGVAADPLTLVVEPQPQVTTPGGCVVVAEGTPDAAWRVTLPNGKSARFALDGAAVKVTPPDGGASWRLAGSTSFILPDGAKVTLGFRMDRKRGLVPENLHVAHGDHDVIITGLSKGVLKATASEARADNEGRFADGDYVVIDADGNLLSLPAAQVVDAKAGNAVEARIKASADGGFEVEVTGAPLRLPPAALPLLVAPDPDEP